MPEKTEIPPPIPSALTGLGIEQQVAILTAAYNKHIGTLAAIESSQQSLLNLVLGIYSAALTLLVGLFKDNPGVLAAHDCFLSPLGWVMIVAAVAIAAYTFFMSHYRNKARQFTRIALERVDFAFGFFEPDRYLKGATLYPAAFRVYTQGSFLSWQHLIVYLPAVAFILAVIILGQAA